MIRAIRWFLSFICLAFARTDRPDTKPQSCRSCFYFVVDRCYLGARGARVSPDASCPSWEASEQ